MDLNYIIVVDDNIDGYGILGNIGIILFSGRLGLMRFYYTSQTQFKVQDTLCFFCYNKSSYGLS